MVIPRLNIFYTVFYSINTVWVLRKFFGVTFDSVLGRNSSSGLNLDLDNPAELDIRI